MSWIWYRLEYIVITQMVREKNYRGVPFTFCDLHLQYKDTYRDKNGRKRTRYHAKKMVFSPVSSAVRQNFSA